MVTQVDNSLLKGPLNFDLGTGLALGGDLFMYVDLTAGSGQNPTLILDGTQGAFRRPTLLLNYDASDNASIEFEEEGVIRGSIRYYALLADTDELRISNDVQPTGPTTGTITFEADNRLQVRISESGLETVFGAFRMTSVGVGSLQGDAASKGNLYLDSADDIIKFRDPTGGLHRMLPEGTATGNMCYWNGTSWVEDDEIINDGFSTGRLHLGNATAIAPYLLINPSTGGNSLIRFSEENATRAEIQYFSSSDAWVMETKLLGSTIDINPDQVTAVQYLFHLGVAGSNFNAAKTGVQGGMIILPSYTDTELDDILNESNLTDNKVAGSMVWNSTQATPVFAVGAADGSLWVDAAGTTVNTPV